MKNSIVYRILNNFIFLNKRAILITVTVILTIYGVYTEVAGYLWYDQKTLPDGSIVLNGYLKDGTYYKQTRVGNVQ